VRPPASEAAGEPQSHEHSHQHGDILHQHEHPSVLDTEHSHHPAADAADRGAPGAPAVAGARRLHVVIDGMTCSYCARAAERAIGRLDGVTAVRVDLASRSADVDLEGPTATPERIRRAIHLAGFRAVESADDGR
jgi:copper chaperone CopZ